VICEGVGSVSAHALRLIPQRGTLTVSSIICVHWWNFKTVSLKCHRCIKIKEDIVQLGTLHRTDRTESYAPV